MLQDDLANTGPLAGPQPLVPAGTLGEIVALRRDSSAPFTVQFPGFPHKAALGNERLRFEA